VGRGKDHGASNPRKSRGLSASTAYEGRFLRKKEKDTSPHEDLQGQELKQEKKNETNASLPFIGTLVKTENRGREGG